MLTIVRRTALLASAVIGLVLPGLSCKGDSATGPQLPKQLEVVSGDGQTGAVAAPLALPLRVRVMSGGSAALPGIGVRFAVKSGGGRLSSSEVATNTLGLAEVRWTLGTVSSDTQTVQASVLSQSGDSLVRTFYAVARPSGAARLDVVSGDSQLGVVGVELPSPLVVRVTDSHGNGIAGQAVAFRVIAGGGSVFGGTANTDLQGIARERWTLGTGAGFSHRLEARALDSSGAALTRLVVANARPGAAAALVKAAGDNQRVLAGTVLAESLAVRVVDSYGNPVSSAQVTWTVTGGSVSPSITSSNDSGLAKSSWTLGGNALQDTALASLLSGTPRIPFTADGELAWVNVTPPDSGPYLSHYDLAYDNSRGVAVAVGVGWSGSLETWEWAQGAWVQRAPVNSPTFRVGSAVAYDAAARRVLLFGGTPVSGQGSPALNDLWAWDGVTWSNLVVGTKPPARWLHAMAYDSRRQRLVLYGGSGTTGGALDDTWEWDGTNWSQVTPPVSPPPMAQHEMVFDSARGRVVLLGVAPQSSYNSPYVSDTWEWDGSTWTHAASGGPPARIWHALAYDAVRRRVVLAAGRFISPVDPPGFYDLADTWEWDGAHWLQRQPFGEFRARAEHSMAFIPGRGVTLFTGRTPSGAFIRDVFEYRLP
jgi:hypothetical protein